MILQPTEKRPHTQKSRQNERAEKNVLDEGKSKNPQKQLSEVKIGNLSENDFNDSKHDPRSHKKNGGTD